MSKMIIVEGNSNDKNNVRAFMVKGEKGDPGDLSGADIIDNLTSTDNTKVLSAKQGKILKDLVDTNTTNISTNTTNISNETSARENADVALQNQITSLASGSPLVASSTSEMTETSRVYVNTTDGKWYYYNGSNWVIGGDYQSTGIANNSINYENLSTRLQNQIGYKSISYTNKNFKVSTGINNSQGSEYGTNTRFTTGFLTLNYIQIIGLSTYQYNIYKYDKTTLSYIGSEGWKEVDNSYYNCNDNYLYKISFRTDDIEELDSSNLNDVSVIDYNIKNNISIFNLDNNLKKQIKMNLITFDWEVGTINSSGNNSDNIHRLRTIDYYKVDTPILIKNDPSFSIWVFDYNSNKTFNSRTLYQGYGNLILTPTNNHFYRFVYFKDDTYEMQTSDVSNLSIECYSKDLTITLPDKYIESIDTLDFTFNSHGFNTGSYESGITMVKDYLVEFGVSDDNHSTYSKCNIYKINLTTKTADYIKSIDHNFGHVNSVDYCTANDTLVFGNGSGDFTLKGKFYVYENFYETITNNLISQINISNAIEYDCTNYDIGNEYKFNCCWGDGNLGNYDTIILVTNNYRNIRKIQLGKLTNQLELGNYNSSASNFNGTFKIIKEYSQVTGTATGTDNTYCVQDLSYFNNKLYGGVGHNLNLYWEMILNEDSTITRTEHYISSTDLSGNNQNISIANIFVTKDYLICNMGKYLVINK